MKKLLISSLALASLIGVYVLNLPQNKTQNLIEKNVIHSESTENNWTLGKKSIDFSDISRPGKSPFQTTKKQVIAENFDVVPALSNSILPEKSSEIKTPNGLILQIPANAFVDETGKIITTPVNVVVKEVLEVQDMILANLQTTSGDKLLSSGGMYEIRAFSEGKEVQLAQNKSINAIFPSSQLDSEMKLFYGEKKSNGQIDWTSTQEFTYYSPNYVNLYYKYSKQTKVPKKEFLPIVKAKNDIFAYKNNENKNKYKLVWEEDAQILKIKNEYESNLKLIKKIKENIAKIKYNEVESKMSQKLNDEIKKQFVTNQDFSYYYIHRYHFSKQLQSKYKISASDEKKIIKIYNNIQKNTNTDDLTRNMPVVKVKEDSINNILDSNKKIMTQLLDFQMSNLDILGEMYPNYLVSRVDVRFRGDYKKENTNDKVIFLNEKNADYTVSLNKYGVGINLKTPKQYHNIMVSTDLSKLSYNDLIESWANLNILCKKQFKIQIPSKNSFCQKASLIPQDENTAKRFIEFKENLKKNDKMTAHYDYHIGAIVSYSFGEEKFDNSNNGKKVQKNVAISNLGYYNCDKFVNQVMFTLNGKIKNQIPDSLAEKTVVYLVAQNEKIVLTDLLHKDKSFNFRFPKDKSFYIIAIANNEAFGYCKVKSITDKVPELVVNQASKEEISKNLSKLFGENNKM